MKNMNKKGQGAMEYLMTYGWAIMVVLIVGIVLWQLGIFNLGGTTKTFTGFGAVRPISWAITSAGTGTIAFVNGEGARIGNFADGGGTGCTLDCSAIVTNISAGVEFQCDLTACTAGDAGDPYDLQISLSYDKFIGILTEGHKSTGDLKGPYE